MTTAVLYINSAATLREKENHKNAQADQGPAMALLSKLLLRVKMFLQVMCIMDNINITLSYSNIDKKILRSQQQRSHRNKEDCQRKLTNEN